MANISLLSKLVNGIQRQVDLSSNTLVVQALTINGSSLTSVILDQLTAMYAASNGDGTYDNRYYTKTQLNKNTASAGSTLIGDDASYSNFTPAAATVKGALSGIDTALGNIATGVFYDGSFKIENTSDHTKILAFDASAIATSTTRTITMPNANVSLADVNNAILKDGSRTYTADQPMGSHKLTGLSAGASAGDSVRYEQAILTSGANAFAANQDLGGHKLTGLAAGTTAGDAVRYEQAILASGVNAFAADQSLGGHKLTNVSDPTSAQDAATKAYVDANLLGLKPKQAVRVASTANLTIASAVVDGAVVDGVTLATGDRILLKDQSTASQNGIYIVAASGAASRATDFASISPIDEINGAWVAVQEGTAAAGKVYVQYGTVATLGTDAINFEYFNPIAALIGGDMITFSGSTFSVDLATVSGLESSNPGNAAGQLRVKLEASNPSLKITGSNELAAKLDAAGAITSGSAGLAVAVDNSTIAISSDQLIVKAGGITNTQVSASAAIAYSKLALTGSIVNADVNASAAIAYSKLALTGSIVDADINASAAIAYSKLALTNSIVDADISSSAAISLSKLAALTASRVLVSDGSGVISVSSATSANLVTLTNGSNADALHQHAVVEQSVVVGEAMAANTSFLVRWAVNGETAGRVYKADQDATSADKFWAVGILSSGSSLSAGNSATMIKLGTYALASSDSAFASSDIGKPVYLTAAGAFSVTAPSTTNYAAYKIGMVQTTTSIDVGNMQICGVN